MAVSGDTGSRSPRLRRSWTFLLGILLLPTIPFLLVVRFLKRRKTSVRIAPADKSSS